MGQAARLGDPIGHSPTMNYLLRGAIIGAAVGLAAVAIVGTGGLAAAAVVGGLVAGGAGIGEMMSTMSDVPKEVTGTIVGPGSLNVFVNGRPAARAHLDMTMCAKHAPAPLPIATGSSTVYINAQPAARVSDTIACSAVITSGSEGVFIGGAAKQTDPISPENLVPPIVHAAIMVVGIGSAVVLTGPIVAVAGIAMGMAGGMAGSWAGGKLFGEGSDAQKWSALGGGVVGGLLGGFGGNFLAGRFIPQPTSALGGFARGGAPGMNAVRSGNAAAAEGANAQAGASAARGAQAADDAAAARPPNTAARLTEETPVPVASKAPVESVFDKRVPSAEVAAENVVGVMKGLVNPNKSPVVQILTHEDGTVSVGISGNLKVPATVKRISTLQDALDKKFGPGVYRVGTSTLDDSHGLLAAKDANGNVIGNSPGFCAEPKAAMVAGQNQSPITGSATIWRGKEPNPHVYTGPNANNLSSSQMNPCATCGLPHNQQIYNNVATNGLTGMGP